MNLLLLADVAQDGHEDFEVVLRVVGFGRFGFVARYDELDVFFVLRLDSRDEDADGLLRLQTFHLPTQLVQLVHGAEFAGDGPRLRALRVQGGKGLMQFQHDLVDDQLRRALEDVDEVVPFDGTRGRRRDGLFAPNEAEMIDGLEGGVGCVWL